jgi:hypothetical protein
VSFFKFLQFYSWGFHCSGIRHCVMVDHIPVFQRSIEIWWSSFPCSSVSSSFCFTYLQFVSPLYPLSSIVSLTLLQFMLSNILCHLLP